MLERIEKIKLNLEDPPTTAAASNYANTSLIRRKSVFEPQKSVSNTFFEAKRFSHIIPANHGFDSK